VHSNNDGQYVFHGVYHTVTPGELIIQTFEFDGAPDQVWPGVRPVRGSRRRTRVTLHSVFPSVEAQEAALASGMNHGIIESMERVDELLPNCEAISDRGTAVPPVRYALGRRSSNRRPRCPQPCVNRVAPSLKIE